MVRSKRMEILYQSNIGSSRYRLLSSFQSEKAANPGIRAVA